jgi:glutamate-1-semialdehyde 2,1-aminomutase
VGALLVFDEVITGFRLGLDGAQGRFNVKPDLTCFGKVIGGGLPIGAVGGRRDVMENLTPLGKVFHAGTLAGNPMATAAGLAALSELNSDVYAELESRATRLASLITDATTAAGLPVTTSRVGTLVGIYLGNALGGSRLPINFDEAKKTDEALYARLFHSLLNEGVAMAPGAYEAIFVGLGHTEAVMNDLAERFHRAARAVTA